MFSHPSVEIITEIMLLLCASFLDGGLLLLSIVQRRESSALLGSRLAAMRLQEPSV